MSSAGKWARVLPILCSLRSSPRSLHRLRAPMLHFLPYARLRSRRTSTARVSQRGTTSGSTASSSPRGCPARDNHDSADERDRHLPRQWHRLHRVASVSGDHVSPSVPQATLTYNGARYVETVPSSFKDNVFLSGIPGPVPFFTVPAGGWPGGIKLVTLQISANLPAGVSLQWQWGAAVYSPFPRSLWLAQFVKPLHSTSLDQFHNGDQAGTPENVKQYVVGGARGGGGPTSRAPTRQPASAKAGPPSFGNLHQPSQV